MQGSKEQAAVAKKVDLRTLRRLTEAHLAKESSESKGNAGEMLRQVILGGQDGLVNVLGIILGVAKATNDGRMVLIAGTAATFAESISMGAVAYTSSQATRDYYLRQLEREKWEMKHLPGVEREEIRLIYMQKGFRGKELDAIVRKVTGDKALWLETMMREELGFSEEDAAIKPLSQGLVVMLSAFGGSFIPLLPFFLLPVSAGIAVSLAVAIVVLFAAGAIKGRLTTGNPIMRGIEMAVIGTVSALAGYAIGALFSLKGGV